MSGNDERNAERMAYLFGCLFNLSERSREAKRMLREYREYFDDATPCRAVLNIKGEHFECDLSRGHEDSLAHSSKAAEAIWGYSDIRPIGGALEHEGPHQGRSV